MDSEEYQAHSSGTRVRGSGSGIETQPVGEAGAGVRTFNRYVGRNSTRGCDVSLFVAEGNGNTRNTNPTIGIVGSVILLG